MTFRRQPSAVCVRVRLEREAERFLLERLFGAAETEVPRRRPEVEWLAASEACFAVDFLRDGVLRCEEVELAADFLLEVVLRFGAAVFVVVVDFLLVAVLRGEVVADFLLEVVLRFGAAFLVAVFLLEALLREAALRFVVVRAALFLAEVVFLLAVDRFEVLFLAPALFLVRRLLEDADARRRWSVNMALPPIV